MPKMSCMKNGVKGVKWGESGTCYTGPNAEAKMNKQRRAIEASKHLDNKRKKYYADLLYRGY